MAFHEHHDLGALLAEIGRYRMLCGTNFGLKLPEGVGLLALQQEVRC